MDEPIRQPPYNPANPPAAPIITKSIDETPVLSFSRRLEPRHHDEHLPETRWLNFHRLWTLCTFTKGYNKQAWLDVEKQLMDAGIIVDKKPEVTL